MAVGFLGVKTMKGVFDMTQRRIKVELQNELTRLNVPKTGFFKQISIIEKSTEKTLIAAKFYDRGQTIHCVVRMYDSDGNYSTAQDKAGGYGYHKSSAALAGALNKCGVTGRYKHGMENGGKWAPGLCLSGRGDGAMIAVLESVAKKLTTRKTMTHTATEY
jgi:hypothetical protein